MISAVPSVSSVHVELDSSMSSTTGRTDVTTKERVPRIGTGGRVKDVTGPTSPPPGGKENVSVC